MRVACLHCFTIEAVDHADAQRILSDLQTRINVASTRLGIGYKPGFATGQPQPQTPRKERDE